MELILSNFYSNYNKPKTPTILDSKAIIEGKYNFINKPIMIIKYTEYYVKGESPDIFNHSGEVETIPSHIFTPCKISDISYDEDNDKINIEIEYLTVKEVKLPTHIDIEPYTEKQELIFDRENIIVYTTDNQFVLTNVSWGEEDGDINKVDTYKFMLNI